MRFRIAAFHGVILAINTLSPCDVVPAMFDPCSRIPMHPTAVPSPKAVLR